MQYYIVAGSFSFLLVAFVMIWISARQHEKRKKESDREFNAILTWNDQKDRLQGVREKETNLAIPLSGDREPELGGGNNVVPLDQKRRNKSKGIAS